MMARPEPAARGLRVFPPAFAEGKAFPVRRGCHPTTWPAGHPAGSAERHPRPSGDRFAPARRKIPCQLRVAASCVISGLAGGIATAAPQGALAAKGRTIAVIRSGLMNLHPPDNRGLAGKIAQSGTLVREYFMETSRRPADLSPSQPNCCRLARRAAGSRSGVQCSRSRLRSRNPIRPSSKAAPISAAWAGSGIGTIS